jgi:hypothetical protein
MPTICTAIRLSPRAQIDIIVVEPSAKLRRSRDFLIALLKTSRSRVQSKTLLPRLGLNDIGALAAESFVPSQDIGYLGGVPPFEEDRQSDAVFDRLICALPDMRKHSMCCVAE